MDNFFVIPKRALFLQSIVNLKLLKRESEKMSKRATIVTQDEAGILIAGKAGVAVCSSIEGLENRWEMQASKVQDKYAAPMEQGASMISRGTLPSHADSDKRERLSVVGTGDFYDDGVDEKSTSRLETRENPGAHNQKKEIISPMIVSAPNSFSRGVEKRVPERLSVNSSNVINDVGRRGSVAVNYHVDEKKHFPESFDLHKQQRLERMFQGSAQSKEKARQTHISLNRKSGRSVFIFLIVCIFLLGGILGYVLIPSAKITVMLGSQREKRDVSVIAKEGVVDISQESKQIPLTILESEETIIGEYEASGISDLSGQRAKGKVTIFNEYSEESQQLVATTRLQSSDGKIFRINRDIEVPGMKVVNGKVVAGAVEAEVVADQPGAEYNIGASEFRIPGFEGGPKFEKFSAKSSEKMLGGASDGSASKVVTKDDIVVAKKKAEDSAKQAVIEKTRSQLEEGNVLLDEALELTIAESLPKAKAGDVRETFEYSVKVIMKAAIFSQEDAKKIVLSEFDEKHVDVGKKALIREIRLDYAGITPRFSEKDMSMKIHAEIFVTPSFDEESFRNDALGKESQQIQQLLVSYPHVQNVNIEFRPEFLSRVPQYASQVDIEVTESFQ